MNTVEDTVSWKLRDLALSELVPIRVRNVVLEQPANNSFLQLDLRESLRRWPEVEAYLLDCRNMGEGSCRQLRDALEAIVTGIQKQEGIRNSTNRFDEIQTLKEFFVSKYAPVRIRNILKNQGVYGPILQLTPKQALERWDEIENYFSRCSSIGNLTCQRLHQALQSFVGIDPSAAPCELVPYITSREFGIVDSVKAAFLELPRSHPLYGLLIDDALIYLPIFRYRLQVHSSIGQSKIEQFEKQMQLLAKRDHQSCDQNSFQDLLVEQLTDNPTAFQSSSVILELFGGETSRAKIRELIGDCTIVDLVRKREVFQGTNKPWFADCVATFLFESKSWFEVRTDQLSLSKQGLSMLKIWCQDCDVTLSSEWICLHLVIRLLSATIPIQTRNFVMESQDQHELLAKLIDGKSLHREAVRRRLIKSNMLSKLVDQIGVVITADQETEISTDELFDCLLNATNARHRQIVLSRYAPDSGPFLTLEETGQLFNVTRERVRQITQKWHERIKNNGQAAVSEKYLKRVGPAWIDVLSEKIERSSGELGIDDLVNAFSKQEKLILAACNLTPKEWLERHSHVVEGRLILIHADDERIREAEEFLGSVLALKPELPILASRIAYVPDHFNRTVFATNAFQSGQVAAIKTPAGIVIAENSTASARRLAFVMSIFEHHEDWILSDQQLWNSICNSNGDRSARGQWRVFTDSLRNEPRRFRKISRVGWMDLMDCRRSEEYKPDRGPLLTPRVDMGSRDKAMGDENQRGKLYSLISHVGGLYAKECIDLWAKHDETGTGTTAGFLLDDPFFVICHPGMTSCLDDHGEIVNIHKVRDRLRNKESLQTYMQFRQSGFGPLDFPAWDTSMLEAWQDFARSNIRDDVAQVIIEQLQNDIEISHEVRSLNTASRSMTPDFGYLDSPRRPADSMVPSLEEVFLLAAVATRFGFLNYYLVNCCTGRHWFSHRSISWLSLLVAAGIIEGTDHWQKMHRVTEKGTDLLYKLVEFSMEFEELNWSKVSLGQEILDQIVDTWRDNTRDTWVVSEQFSKLLVALTDPIRRNGKALLNPEVFQLSNSRKRFPVKENASTSAFVDPFLDGLLG